MLLSELNKIPLGTDSGTKIQGNMKDFFHAESDGIFRIRLDVDYVNNAGNKIPGSSGFVFEYLTDNSRLVDSNGNYTQGDGQGEYDYFVSKIENAQLDYVVFLKNKISEINNNELFQKQN